MGKRKNHTAPLLYMLVKLGFLIMLGGGTFMMLGGVIGITEFSWPVVTAIVAAAVIALAADRLIKRRLVRWLVLIFVWACFVWLNAEAVFSGAQTAANAAGAAAEAYFNRTVAGRADFSARVYENICIFLSAASAAWEGLLVTVNLKKGHPALTAVFVGTAAALVFAVGQVPQPEALFVTALGFLGFVSMNTDLQKHCRASLKSTAAAVLIFSAVTGIVVWAMPEDGYIKETHKEDIRTAVRQRYQELGEYFEENGFNPAQQYFGIGEGRLDRAGNLEYTGQMVMKVGMNRHVSGPVYLKAYAAGNFDNNRWEEMEDDVLSDISTGFAKNTSAYLKDIWNIGYYAFDDGGGTFIAVETADTADSHFYVPYGALLENGDEMAAEGYVTRLDGGQTRAVSYADRFSMMMGDTDSFAAAGMPSAALNSYGDYVRENYLSVEGMSEQFQKDYKVPDGSSAEVVTDYIKERFADEGIYYTLEPGSLPFGENAIEYFLYQNKKGYCMHFASAAVMIYRLNGIPARYAEGYMVLQGSFRQISSGYDTGESPLFESVVRDYQAHAWPEVFIDNFGWVPVEVTPAYTEGTLPPITESSGDSENLEESSGSEETESESSEDTADGHKSDADGGSDAKEESSADKENGSADSENGGSNERGTAGRDSKKVFSAWILTMCLCMIAAAALIVTVTIYRQRRAEGLLCPPYTSKTAETLWRFFTRWLMLAGAASAKSGDGRLMLEEIVSKQILQDEAALACLTDKLLKAAYSRDGLKKEEYEMAVSLYRQFAGEIYPQLSIFKKFAAKAVWCLPGKDKKDV